MALSSIPWFPFPAAILHAKNVNSKSWEEPVGCVRLECVATEVSITECTAVPIAVPGGRCEVVIIIIITFGMLHVCVYLHVEGREGDVWI